MSPVELTRLFALGRRWWWLLILGLVIGAGASYVVSRAMTPIYRASSTLLVNETQTPGTLAYNDILTSERLTKTYKELITQRPVLEDVIADLNLAYTAGELSGMLNVDVIRDTQLIRISAESSDPALAQVLADTIAQVFIERKVGQQQARFEAGLADLDAQVAALESSIGETQKAISSLGDPLDPEDTAGLEPDVREKIQNLVYVGPFLDSAAQGAAVLLPSTAWSEEEGSYVNFEGRVQWVKRCHLPRGEGRPGWRLAADLGVASGLQPPEWSTHADVLESMAQSVSEFQGLNEETIGLLGAMGVTARAGA